MSPLAVALGVVGVAAGALDKSAVVAVVAGAAAWVAGAAAAFLRARRRARKPARPSEIDPWSEPEPWRSILAQALGARERFDATLSTWPDGPTRERLAEIQPRLWARIDAIALAAHHAAGLGGAGGTWPRSVGPRAADLAASLRKVQAELATLPAAAAARRAELEGMEATIASQLRACRERDATATSLLERIRSAALLVDQAVTELTSMAVSQSLSSSMPAGIDDDFDEVAEEIRSLADALERAGIPDSRETP